MVSQFFERHPPSRRSDFLSSVRQAVGPVAMMTPTATPSAIVSHLDDGTAITDSDVADHISHINQDGSDEAAKDEVSTKAGTEQPSNRVTTAASHSHDASVGGLTSSSDTTTTAKVPPSARWTSYNDWDYNGMKERLETFMSTLNKSTLVRHAELVMGQKVSISEPFSAGQYWACFELIAADGSLIIARVRLPRHPNNTDAVNEQSELYSITCEVATMMFLRGKVTTVPFPRLYTYAGPESQWAADAGAIYMLIEGFYGNTLQDVQFDICQLPVRGSFRPFKLC